MKVEVLQRNCHIIRNVIRRPWFALKNLRHFLKDFKRFNQMNTRPSFRALWNRAYIFLRDREATAASLDYYFWQDLWAAKKIFEANPSEHFDVGSRVDGFIAHVLSFMPVTVMDIRPLPWKIDGLNFIRADATNLSVIEDNSIDSLSSLCAIEHFGLGRYGDPVDPEACFKAMKSLQRVLRKGGTLYFAVPIGIDATCYNAHRIFSIQTILREFNELQLTDFSTIDTRIEDKIAYTEHASLESFSSEFDCQGRIIGLFEFKKEKE